MGIKNFSTILKHALQSVRHVTYQEFSGQTVAIDGSGFKYRFCHNSQSKRPHPHIDGFYQLFYRLLKFNIRPVLVLDGYAPQEKKLTLEDRAERKQRAIDKVLSLQHELTRIVGAKEVISLEQMSTLLDQVKGTPMESTVTIQVETIRKANKNIIHFPPTLFEDIRQLCFMMNIPIIRATGEADALCAKLYQTGQVQAILSEDSDILMYGGGRLIRKFGWTNEVELVDLQQILQSLHITYEQFIDLALLSGTDYTEPIRGLGPIGALDKIISGLSLEQIVGPTHWSVYRDAKRLIQVAGEKEYVPEGVIQPFDLRQYQITELTKILSEKCRYRSLTIIKHYDQLRTIYVPVSIDAGATPPKPKIKIALKSRGLITEIQK